MLDFGSVNIRYNKNLVKVFGRPSGAATGDLQGLITENRLLYYEHLALSDKYDLIIYDTETNTKIKDVNGEDYDFDTLKSLAEYYNPNANWNKVYLTGFNKFFNSYASHIKNGKQYFNRRTRSRI